MLLDVTKLNIFCGEKHIVHDLNLSIKSNQFATLIGESGSGKSLTAQSILRLYRNIDYSGQINFQGQNILELSEKELSKIRGKDIGFIFQNPFTSLNPTQTIHKQITEAIKIHNPKINRISLQARVAELLNIVELSQFQNKQSIFPLQLSGGQQQRVVIAIAIANNPQLIIADEPTTALDPNTEDVIIGLFQKLNQNRKIAILLITHNIDLVRKCASNIAVMHQGRIIEQGDHTAVLQNPQQEYTKILLTNNHQKLIEVKPIKASIILDIKNLNTFAMASNFSLLKKKQQQILHNIDLSLHRGETLGIIGQSGSGKSTLAKSLTGLISTIYSSFIINGQNIIKFTSKIRREIQIILQDPFDNLNPYLTILRNITEGMCAHKIQDHDLIIGLLHDVGLDPSILQKYPRECSGGERQRICLVRSLVLQPKILILDETTSALDILTAQNILKILVELQRKYHTSYIFISHNIAFVKQISHRILELNDGRIAGEL